MADPLKFDLVAPERLLVSDDVASVVVPGSEGYFTVLARHAPLVSTLKPGLLEVQGLAGEEQKFFIRGGFAEVTPVGLTVLADQAILLSELDAATLDQEIRNAEEDLADAGEDHLKRRRAETKLDELRDVRRWIIPA
jgi:F-type H+-transporting ATPase subunit epsilon